MQTPLSILVVDDEVELANLFKDYFDSKGMNAVSFTNPFIALEFFKNNSDKFPLLITDLRMPGMNGLELAQKLRELNSSLKIFLITAFDTADLENSEFYQKARIDRIVHKPIKLSELGKLVEETFNK